MAKLNLEIFQQASADDMFDHTCDFLRSINPILLEDFSPIFEDVVVWK